MSERCHYETDPVIGRWFYPGCMGGAIYGKGGCTCRASITEKNTRQRLRELSDRVSKLEAQLTTGAKQ